MHFKKRAQQISMCKMKMDYTQWQSMVRLPVLVCIGCQENKSRDQTGRENRKPQRALYACGSAASFVLPHNHGFRKQLHMSFRSLCSDGNSGSSCHLPPSALGFLPHPSVGHRSKNARSRLLTVCSSETAVWGGGLQISWDNPHLGEGVHKCFSDCSQMVGTLQGIPDTPPKAPKGPRVGGVLAAHGSHRCNAVWLYLLPASPGLPLSLLP